jgi:hypothetical protein
VNLFDRVREFVADRKRRVYERVAGRPVDGPGGSYHPSGHHGEGEVNVVTASTTARSWDKCAPSVGVVFPLVQVM